MLTYNSEKGLQWVSIAGGRGKPGERIASGGAGGILPGRAWTPNIHVWGRKKSLLILSRVQPRDGWRDQGALYPPFYLIDGETKSGRWER